MPSLGTILLVDDDPDIGLALSDYLQQEGFKVEIVATAQETLQKIQAQPYDAVLLDVGLPDRDGLDVLNELSHHHPHLPVILLTAYTALRKTGEPAILNKAFAYLTKPYNREEVRKTLERALSVRTAATPLRPDNPSATHAFPALLQFTDSPPSYEAKTGEPRQLNLQQFERLARYVQLMQFAFDQVPEAVLLAGPDKRFYFVNKAACDSLGYTREELLALRIPDVAPHHDTRRFRQHLETLHQGQPLIYQSIHRTKDGREFPIEISVHLLNFQGQEFTCAITRALPCQKDLTHGGE